MGDYYLMTKELFEFTNENCDGMTMKETALTCKNMIGQINDIVVKLPLFQKCITEAHDFAMSIKKDVEANGGDKGDILEVTMNQFYEKVRHSNKVDLRKVIILMIPLVHEAIMELEEDG